MTLAMTGLIVFHANDHRPEDLIIAKFSEAEFESSWKELTSRGSITLARNVKFFDKRQISSEFKRGDALTLYLGYDGDYVKEFTGYISEVSADIPIVLKFEDEMFKVRKIDVNFSSPNIILEKLLKTIIPGYEIDALEGVNLGAVRLAKTQVGPVLEKLKSDWGLHTYMKDKQVVCGKYYADDTSSETIQFNLERDIVSQNLTYKRAYEISLKIKVVSTLANGTKVEVDGIGDKDGNERQLTFYNISSKAELERLGKLEYEKYKVDRFEGSFTAFGIPSVKHGMKVELTSLLYDDGKDKVKNDRNGVYYVEKVVKTFGSGGYRQEITLGDKVI